MSQLGTDRLPPGFGISQHRAFTLGTTGERTRVGLGGRMTSTPLNSLAHREIPALIPAQAHSAWATITSLQGRVKVGSSVLAGNNP